MLDAEHGEAARVDQLGVVAVIGLVLVEDVAERVPMRRALHAQHQRVVGVTDLVPVLLAGDGVGAGRQHLVDRVEAAAEQAVLRAGLVERDAEREHLAGPDQARGLDDVLRRDVIERADLVVLAPAAPVLTASSRPPRSPAFPTLMSMVVSLFPFRGARLSDSFRNSSAILRRAPVLLQAVYATLVDRPCSVPRLARCEPDGKGGRAMKRISIAAAAVAFTMSISTASARAADVVDGVGKRQGAGGAVAETGRRSTRRPPRS